MALSIQLRIWMIITTKQDQHLTRPNLISPQSTIWLGENHSLRFNLTPAGTQVSCGMLNVIEYDVVPS